MQLPFPCNSHPPSLKIVLCGVLIALHAQPAATAERDVRGAVCRAGRVPDVVPRAPRVRVVDDAPPSSGGNTGKRKRGRGKWEGGQDKEARRSRKKNKKKNYCGIRGKRQGKEKNVRSALTSPVLLQRRDGAMARPRTVAVPRLLRGGRAGGPMLYHADESCPSRWVRCAEFVLRATTISYTTIPTRSPPLAFSFPCFYPSCAVSGAFPTFGPL